MVEDLSFVRLGDGLAGDASRPALQANVTNCFIPESHDARVMALNWSRVLLTLGFQAISLRAG